MHYRPLRLLMFIFPAASCHYRQRKSSTNRPLAKDAYLAAAPQVCLASGSTGVGINTNWGDTAKLTNIKVNGGKPTAANICCTYTGVAQGNEPPKIGWCVLRLMVLYNVQVADAGAGCSGDSYSACQYTASSVGTC